MKDLIALRAKHAPHVTAEHRKLKKKSEIVDAVPLIFSHTSEKLTTQVALLWSENVARYVFAFFVQSGRY